MKKRPKSLFYIILLLTSISTFAQEQLDRYYLFKNYNTRNGLINNTIYSLTADKYNFIWIGSNLGLSRFDGKSFYHNAIPTVNENSSSIYYLYTTDNGNIICSAYMQGIYEQFDDGRFNNYYTLPKNVRKNIFYSIKQRSDETILLGGTQGLFKIDGDSLLLLYDEGIPRMFFTLEVDNNNNIWFGGINGLGTMKLDSSGYKPLFIPELKDQFIVFILFDKQGTLHVATSRGYYKIEFEEPFIQGSKYTISRPFKETSEKNINHIYLDYEQNIWISTASDGTFRTRGDSITMHLTINNGLLSSSVMCMTQDKEGNYYFGTNNGISIVKDFNTYAFSKDGKLFQDVNQILTDKYDRIWMQSPGILNFLQNGQIYQIDIKNTLFEKFGNGTFYINEQSEMWLFSNNKLFRIPITGHIPDMKKAEKLADIAENTSLSILSIFEDNNGVWLTARSKIYNYHHDRILPVTFNHPDSSILSLRYITKDNFGYYWISDFDNGLYRATMTENTKNKVVFENIIDYKSLNYDSTFLTTGIYYLTVDKKSFLWQATSQTGVYKHTLDNMGIKTSKLYSTENGLLSNNVFKIDCKEDGEIWFYTQKGICILSQDSGGEEHFYYLDEKDGVVGRPYNSIKIGDQIFTLTDEGFFVSPDKLTKETKAITPKVLISKLTVSGTDYTTWVYKNQMLPLNYTQNNLVFDFTSISFSSVDELSYQYKLDGIDDEWSELSNRGYKEYTSLRPGKYTFYVRAVSRDGIFSDETTFTFKIRPAFYQTVWFYLLILILISVVVYIFYRNRINHVIKTERIRSRIAADLHDDIGSTLSSIFLMSEMTSSNDKQARLAEVLHKIGENSRDILNSMDDIIWSVNPQDDSLTNLTVRLREYAIPVCESRGIDISMNIEDIAGKTKLGMDERRNIFLITKEAINNAVKHSGCTALSVIFSVTGKYIEVSVTDNGHGFDPSSPTSRNGVKNMKRRALQIGSELDITSEKDKGTTVRLKTKNHMFI